MKIKGFSFREIGELLEEIKGHEAVVDDALCMLQTKIVTAGGAAVGFGFYTDDGNLFLADGHTCGELTPEGRFVVARKENAIAFDSGFFAFAWCVRHVLANKKAAPFAVA